MISIIIPVYNGEKYIKRNFDSIINQDYRDFEVIYVNDGSKDKSIKILNDLSSKVYDFSVKVINKSNGGVSSARNIGLENAVGDYICFIDVDDEITHDYLSYMLNLMLTNSADLVFCATNKDNMSAHNPVHETFFTKQQALECFLYRKISIGVWSTLCKSSTFKNNNLRFAESYKYSEDIHMIWRVFNNCDKIVGTSKKMYIYYSCPGSAMSKFNEERLHGVELMEQLQDYFEKTNPEFAPLYKKFAVSRMYWAITWQGAIKLTMDEFNEFCDKHNIKYHMKQLLKFKSLRVSVSSFLFLISPKLYKNLAIKVAKNKVH